MTVITKLSASGFKSFAKKTDLLFGNNFNCILGPNGSGKCLDYNSTIQLSNGSLVKIGDIVNEGLSKDRVKIDDGYMAFPEDLEVISLDVDNLKGVPRKVKTLVKRTAPENMLRIKTRSGKEIKATEYHPLFIFDNGKIRSIKAEELKEGIKIAVPREIKLDIKSKYFFELMDLVKVEDNLYVPFDEEYKNIAFKVKGKDMWKDVSSKLNIPLNVFKGIVDRQSINFAYLIKILRESGLKNEDIIKLVPYIKAKNQNIKYKIPWKNSKEFSRFFGYLIAEGRLPPESDQIWFTNGSEEIVADYKKLVDSLFEVKSTVSEYKPRCWDVLAYSAPIRTVLNKFGMSIGTTGDKTLTNLFLSHSGEEELVEFLDGYYSGDGYVGESVIEVATKSKKLGEAVENILSRLGILHNSSLKVKIATNSGFSGIYKIISIYGVENFSKFHSKIKFTHKRKQSKLESLINLKSNPNVDLLEVNSLIKDVVKDLGIKVKPNRKEFPRLDSYCYNGCTPSVSGVNHLIKNLFSSYGESQSLVQLNMLASSNIYWDEIVEIERYVPEHKWVYDLCVEKDHNFVANGIYVHNSNVMDALCFVLGKSSAKGLRAEKSANLIYNGGKKGQPSKKAEVHIYFDNSKNEFPFNTSEIKISRVLNQKGVSKYLVNDKTHTRQQVVDLLGKVGVNPDGHNIVLQGDIVHFMEMKPNDRRDLISDISGISIFDDKKNKSLRELEKVEGKLTEANVLLVEREANLRELKKDRDQAKKYVDLKNKFKDSKATYLHLLLREKKERRDKIQKVQDEHNVKIDVIQDKIKGIRNSITEKQNEIQEINYQLDQKGEGELKLLQMEIGSLRSGVYKHEARVETVKNELLKIKNRKKQLLADISENEKKIGSLNKEKVEFNKKINLIKEEDKVIDNKLVGFRKKYGIENLGDINVKLSELDRKIEEREKLLNGAGEAKQDLVRELDRVSFRLDSIKKEMDRLNESKNSKSLLELRKKHEVIEKQLNKVVGEDSILSGRVGEGWSKLNSLESELSKFRAKEVGIKEGILNDKSIDKVKKINGVFGTVSELGNVEEKYSLALEVAAGARIKSVVTKDDIIAGHCIKELKNNRLGVATFLPLNKIKARRKENVSALLKGSGAYGLAIDLVNFDKKYSNVFDYVFGNTLVVEDIETARKIGIGKIRMVTLGGDLVESSGAMIGGFRGRMGIGFNQKQVSEKVSVLGEELSKLNKGLQDDMERRSEIEHEIESLRNKKAELYGDIVKIEKSLGIGSSEDIIKEKKELDSKKSEFEKELEIINKDFSKFEFEVNDLKKEKNEIKEKLINNPEIKDNLGVLESKKEKLKEKIMNINSDLSILSNQLNMYNSEVSKVRDIINGHNKEEEEFSRELVDLNKVVSGKKTNLKEKEVKEREFYGKNKELAAKRNKLMELMRNKEEGIGKEEDKINEIRNKVNEVSIRLAKAIGEIEGLEVEFEEYKDGKIRKGVSIESLKKDISDFERMMNNIGNINMRALEVYDELAGQYEVLLGKTNKLKSEKDDVLILIGEIEEKKAGVFMKTFNHLHAKFKEIFNSISTKGEASLVLENEANPLEGGVDINVKISGNKKLDIRSLSGGEKTMAALAFIFSIQEYSPASFYLLDEVDAALDKHNSEKLSKLINNYSGNAQYIVISHNDSIITEAHQIYGVSMNEGVSKVTSLRL